MADEKETIMLIDDDEIQLSIVENVLKNEYNVFTAKSGKEAIKQLLNSVVPNIILLDILMPRMDGWETFNKIRGISLLKEIPIIFLTSVTDEAEKQKALELGAVDFIMKPYRIEDLLKSIKDNLKKQNS